jgi:hypothetical protein
MLAPRSSRRGHHAAIAIRRRYDQWSLAILTRCLDVGSSVEQARNRGSIAVVDSLQQ